MSIRYWKASPKLSVQIKEELVNRKKMIAKACDISKEVGGDPKKVMVNEVWGTTYVIGFYFEDETKVDKLLFCPLKNSHNVWRPRVNRKEGSLWSRFEELKSDCLDTIARLIEMSKFNGKEFSVHTPGVCVVNGIAYIQTPDYVTQAKDCTRISDLEYEKATTPKRKPKANVRKKSRSHS